jgi:small-conductance mechanosensitive channel
MKNTSHPALGRYISTFLFLIFAGTFVFAQNDSTQNNDAILSKYEKAIQQLELQDLSDSVQRAELEAQIATLGKTESAQKTQLQILVDQINLNQAKRLAERQSRLDSLKAATSSYPVLGFFKDTLWSIYNKVGSISAQERASSIQDRIRNLASILSFSDSTLQVQASENAIDIIQGETIIMSISDKDALWTGMSKEELGKEYITRINNTVLKYQSEISLTELAKEIGLALVVIFILGLAIYYLNKLFKWTSAAISAQEGKLFHGIQIKNYTLFDAGRQIKVLMGLNTILKWLLIAVLVYLALPIIFGLFPWTQNFAQTLFGYVFNPLKRMATGLWSYLPNLFTISVIVVVFRYAIKGIHFFKKEIEEGKLSISGFYPDWANPTFQILRVVLYAFMFVLIFPYLPGSDSPVFQGVSVFLGFLFTFGSSGSLSNIIAGIVLTYMRLFKLGDRVKIGDVVGDVIEKSMLVTRVKTIKNEIISIPNSTVMSSHTINYSNQAEQGKGLIVHTTITIGYDVPWKQIYQALLTAADRTNLLLKEPKPFVLQTSLDDFYVSYQINAYTKHAGKQAVIYSDLHQHIQDCCNEMGIEILSPHYRAARDGNMTTIPAEYLSKDYEAPSFRVNTK